MNSKTIKEITQKYKKIPCPNCENKLIAMVNGVDKGIEQYKCQVCKAIITYDHEQGKVLEIQRKTKFDREVVKTQTTEKL